VDLIFEGRITGHQHLKDALTRIQEIAIPGISILRVSAPELDHSGRLLIKDSRLVVAALTRDGLYEGYEGVRQILATTIGHYAFLEVGPQDKVDLVPNLNIPVDSILKALPNLPAEPGVLFDEKSLLDKVFTTTASAIAVSEPDSANNPPMSQDLEEAGPAGKRWNVADSVIYMDDPPEAAAGLAVPSSQVPSSHSQDSLAEVEKTNTSSPEFAALDASELKASATREREGRYVRRSHKSPSRMSPLIVVGLLFVAFCAQAAAIINWPRVAAYLKHASNQVDSNPHVSHK
jgi:hypothetical protein